MDTSAPTGKDDKIAPMVAPSLSSYRWVIAAALIIPLGVVLSSKSSHALLCYIALVHILSYAVWAGANIWNTLFVGVTLSQSVPHQLFEQVQAKLCPLLFNLTYGANVMLLVTHFLLASTVKAKAAATAIPLAIALVASLFDRLVVAPKRTRLMSERCALEDKAGKMEEDAARIQALYLDFGQWQGVSAVVNLLIICGTIAYGWVQADLLSAACCPR